MDGVIVLLFTDDPQVLQLIVTNASKNANNPRQVNKYGQTNVKKVFKK